VRHQGLERTLRLVSVLQQRGGHTLDELAAEFGVCTRTIRRDLDVLSVVGFPVAEEAGDWPGERVRFFLAPHHSGCPVCRRGAERAR
jgi:predicted DNA-binding transcriptional regulator YafY